MAQSSAKVKFTADATEFTKAVSEASRKMVELQSELRLNAAQMYTMGESVDTLTQRQKILTQQSQTLADKKAALTEKLRLAEQYFGADSVEAGRLRTQLNNLETQSVKLEGQIAKTAQALAEQEAASVDSRTAFDRLTDTVSEQESKLIELKRAYASAVLEFGEGSREAQDLANEITSLSSDLRRNRATLTDVQSAADQVERGMDDLGDSFQDTEQDASSLSDVIQGNLIADGLQQLGSVLSDVAESTKEYRTIMSALDVSSERAGYSAQETAETYRDLYGVLDDTQAAATTTANLQAMKLAQSDLNEVLDGVIGAWATYGDSIQVDGLAESINETMRCGSVTGAFADVLNWGSQEGDRFGVALRNATDANEDWNNSVEDASSAEDYFNLALEECQTQAERANLIMSVFADQGLTDAGNMWQENNQVILEANQATADQQEILARLGETATPILTAVKNGFNEVLSAVADVTDNLNTQQISQSVEGGFDFLLAHGQTISAIIVGIGAAFASWKVITTVTSVVSKIGSLSKLIAMLSNPVGIAAAAIGALVAAFILLYNNVEPFREVVNQTFSKLVDLFQQARTAAGAFGANVMDALAPLADLASSLWEHMTPLVTLIKENLGQAFNSLSESVQRIRDTLTNTLLPALSTLQPVFWVIAGVLGGVFVEAVGIAVGVVNGIISAIGGLADAVAGVVEIFSNVFELLAGIVTLDGDRCIQAVQGIGQGILDVFGGLWNGVSGFLQGFVDGVVGFFRGLWDTLVGHSIVPDTINGIINCFAGLWGGVRGFVSGFANNVINTWNGIKNTVSTVAGAIQNTVSQKWNVVKSTTSSAFHTVKSTASTGWNSVRSTVVSATENVRSNVQSKWNAVKSVTSAAFGAVKNSAVTSWNSVRSTVASATENVRSNVQSKWNTVKSVTSTAFVAMKNSTVTAWSGMKSTISSAASSVYSTVSSKFNGIRSTISTVMSRARSTVSSAIATIRSKFHFSWSLPKLKLPHLSVTGGFSLTPPSVPKFSIKWYRDGGILQAPTLFGAMGNHLLGGGEAGPEAVAPIDLLQDYVQAAVERTIGSSMTQLTAAIDALASRPIYLQVDGHTIAVATAGDMDDALGTRQVLTARGLCL